MNKQRLKVDKFILITILISFLVLFIGIFAALKLDKSPDLSNSNGVKVKLGETVYSWGKIPINGGNVEKSFTIDNVGTETLKLANIKTSCMCTTARVKIKDKTSPFFGMHSKSSWIGEVAAGEKAEIEVVFDPAYHGPSGIGPITRHIVLETNDKNNSKITFTVTANVVNK